MRKEKDKLEKIIDEAFKPLENYLKALLGLWIIFFTVSFIILF